jgi:hypothetical protein
MRLNHLAGWVRLAGTAAVALLGLGLAGACGGGSNPQPATVTPSPAIAVPQMTGDAAVYLSLGDSIAEQCCPAFADYLARKLNRNVQIVNLAGDESSVDFVAGVNHVRPSQLDKALAAIQQYAASGHPVVAVTLVTGRKDLQQQVASCGDASDACRQAFQSQFMAPFSERLGFVFRQLSLSAPSTPIFSLNYYDPAGCPGAPPAPFTLADVNQTIANVASGNGATLVDISKTAGGCDSLSGATPAPAGVNAIETGLEDAYNALPTLPT